jgi:hypothetical protein
MYETFVCGGEEALVERRLLAWSSRVRELEGFRHLLNGEVRDCCLDDVKAPPEQIQCS